MSFGYLASIPDNRYEHKNSTSFGMLNFTDALTSTSHRFAFHRHHAIKTINRPSIPFYQQFHGYFVIDITADFSYHSVRRIISKLNIR